MLPALVDVAAVIDGQDCDRSGLVVDGKDDPVAASSSNPSTGKLALEGLSDSPGMKQQVAG